jgi:hypothetical protein
MTTKTKKSPDANAIDACKKRIAEVGGRALGAEQAIREVKDDLDALTTTVDLHNSTGQNALDCLRTRVAALEKQPCACQCHASPSNVKTVGCNHCHGTGERCDLTADSHAIACTACGGVGRVDAEPTDAEKTLAVASALADNPREPPLPCWAKGNCNHRDADECCGGGWEYQPPTGPTRRWVQVECKCACHGDSKVARSSHSGGDIYVCEISDGCLVPRCKDDHRRAAVDDEDAALWEPKPEPPKLWAAQRNDGRIWDGSRRGDVAGTTRDPAKGKPFATKESCESWADCETQHGYNASHSWAAVPYPEPCTECANPAERFPERKAFYVASNGTGTGKRWAADFPNQKPEGYGHVSGNPGDARAFATKGAARSWIDQRSKFDLLDDWRVEDWPASEDRDPSEPGVWLTSIVNLACPLNPGDKIGVGGKDCVVYEVRRMASISSPIAGESRQLFAVLHSGEGSALAAVLLEGEQREWAGDAKPAAPKPAHTYKTSSEYTPDEMKVRAVITRDDGKVIRSSWWGIADGSAECEAGERLRRFEASEAKACSACDGGHADEASPCGDKACGLPEKEPPWKNDADCSVPELCRRLRVSAKVNASLHDEVEDLQKKCSEAFDSEVQSVADLHARLAETEQARAKAVSKAEQYERDWYASKSEFGDALAAAHLREDTAKQDLAAEKSNALKIQEGWDHLRADIEARTTELTKTQKDLDAAREDLKEALRQRAAWKDRCADAEAHETTQTLFPPPAVGTKFVIPRFNFGDGVIGTLPVELDYVNGEEIAGQDSTGKRWHGHVNFWEPENVEVTYVPVRHPDSRCDYHPTTPSLLHGPCPRCGAPQCCPVCCRQTPEREVALPTEPKSRCSRCNGTGYIGDNTSGQLCPECHEPKPLPPEIKCRGCDSYILESQAADEGWRYATSHDGNPVWLCRDCLTQDREQDPT